MKKFEVIKCADRTEWLNARVSGIGASEISAVVGVSPWQTSYDLYEKKRSGGEDSDGSIENLMRNSMAGVSKELFNWGLEEHKAGDFASFETSSGTIFIYITGSGETHQAVSVSNKITNEWYENITEAARANCGYDEDAAMGGNVDLVMQAR